jgi:hypothetical protein
MAATGPDISSAPEIRRKKRRNTTPERTNKKLRPFFNIAGLLQYPSGRRKETFKIASKIAAAFGI